MSFMYDIQKKCHQATNLENQTIIIDALDVCLDAEQGRLSALFAPWMTSNTYLRLKDEQMESLSLNAQLIPQIYNAIQTLNNSHLVWVAITSRHVDTICAELLPIIKDDMIKNDVINTFGIRCTRWLCLKNHEQHLDKLISYATKDTMISIYFKNQIKMYAFKTCVHSKTILTFADLQILSEAMNYPIREYYVAHLIYELNQINPKHAQMLLNHLESTFVQSLHLLIKYSSVYHRRIELHLNASKIAKELNDMMTSIDLNVLLKFDVISQRAMFVKYESIRTHRFYQHLSNYTSIIIQAPNKDKLIQFLTDIHLDMNIVKDNIIEYPYHAQIFLDGEIIKDFPVTYTPSDIAMYERYYDIGTLHWDVRDYDSKFFDLSIMDDVSHVYKYDGVTMADALVVYFNEKLKEECKSKIPDILYESNLYKSCMIECLKRLIKQSYYNEDDFYYNGPVHDMHRILSKIIETNQLEKYKNLKYKNLKMFL
jgi:hypothetical protein